MQSNYRCLYLIGLFLGPKFLSFAYHPPPLQVDAHDVAIKATNKERNNIFENCRKDCISIFLVKLISINGRVENFSIQKYKSFPNLWKAL